ncbi:hypothetical protein V476_20810 [Pseudomonas syringae KCTC 12500]|uniref:hypothetical protein n=1 Tax=Pseudomonas syringae TaxID=317 RepID=UPI00040EA50C|nr:hypothetical protein [Pseudomonas syringae]KMY03433.1 hypothetical protein V476_20810 [Pseudomonas syringae KCTC 12500]KPY71019.1 Uncharacterized protein ALO45_02126 [Pseudomonas syringae pv. syringae]POR85727.1 hypothetical protein BKM21_08400 [Pseudomonas syringae pv. syringae]
MLSDLDELILSCEDPRSRKYIEEAVRCYKAGAYRSSVVACWIAVAFDLVDKIKELAAGGDKEAQAELTRFETIQKANNLSGALAFEKDLPLMAKDKFEFISHLEYLDLVRLVEDRNRCAHPSHVSDNQVFVASAELSRLHIHNAVISILSKPAAQGKAALERVLNDLDSKFFPSSLDDVVTLFEAGPLKRCRSALMSNLLKILIKVIIGVGDAPVQPGKCALALSALKIMHPALWEEFFSNCVKQIVEPLRVEDAMNFAVIRFARFNELGMWKVLPKAERLRFLTYVENAPSSLYSELDWFYLVDDSPKEFLLAIEKRVKKATYDEIDESSWFDPPPAVIDRLLEIYQGSSSFAEANRYGRTIRLKFQDSQPTYKQADSLIRIAAANGQVGNSSELPHILRHLSTLDWGKGSLDALIKKNSLKVKF